MARFAAAADLLNAADRVTILAGAGAEGAHDGLVAVAEALKAPVVHAMRGKEFVEYDNPYDVGMTGLLGFASGYRAMEHCDALLMLGTDFPYRPFFPEHAHRPGRHPRRTHRQACAALTCDSLGPSRTPSRRCCPCFVRDADTTHLEQMPRTAVARGRDSTR